METHSLLRLCPFFLFFQMWAIIIKSYKKKPYLLALVSTCGRLKFVTQTSSLFLLWVISQKIYKYAQCYSDISRRRGEVTNPVWLPNTKTTNMETLLPHSFLARRTKLWFRTVEVFLWKEMLSRCYHLDLNPVPFMLGIPISSFHFLPCEYSQESR